MEKVLEGDLARFEVPDLLTLLNMGRRTGVLVLERPDQETKLFFRDGDPVFATSTQEELRLGAARAAGPRAGRGARTRPWPGRTASADGWARPCSRRGCWRRPSWRRCSRSRSRRSSSTPSLARGRLHLLGPRAAAAPPP